MKIIRHKATLVYYDGVQVFEGRDSIGGHYVGLLIDTVDNSDRYLVTGVSPEKLRQFSAGTLDLRTLLLDSSAEEWYMTLVDGDLGQPFTLEPQAGSLSEKDFLPDTGFLLP